MEVSFLAIIIFLIVGLLLLIAGAIAKKKWLMMISILPLAVSIIQIIILFMMMKY